MTDYFSHRFGRKAGVCVIAVIFTSYFGGLAAQIAGSGKVLSELSGLPYTASVAISAGATLIYIVSGGFKSVDRTDVFQFILMGILLLIVTWAISTRLQVPIRGC
jgi:cation/acetate symporter